MYVLEQPWLSPQAKLDARSVCTSITWKDNKISISQVIFTTIKVLSPPSLASLPAKQTFDKPGLQQYLHYLLFAYKLSTATVSLVTQSVLCLCFRRQTSRSLLGCFSSTLAESTHVFHKSERNTRSSQRLLCARYWKKVNRGKTLWGCCFLGVLEHL